MSERNTDAADFAHAIRIVRERFPLAVSIQLETSDQGYDGFVLRDVTMPDGASLEETNPDGFAKLADAVEEFLSCLGWNGVVGEDYHGYATVSLTIE